MTVQLRRGMGVVMIKASVLFGGTVIQPVGYGRSSRGAHVP
ncbi:hypothetical protein [Streptomyces sp. XY332]|nr:hypothetical protein [Streptomyces sp. XY332]